jgi:hydroxymethylpyrimidine/phosphomethylpyrimidine kinase
MKVPPVVLSIAGFDPSSGAGITADVKTAAAQGCFAVTCITALTVQSSQGVFRVQPLEPSIVARTLGALAEDLEIAAVRLGMLGSGAVANAIVDFLEAANLPNVVLDPVIRASTGAPLVDEAGLDILRKRLLPVCDVITPNLEEAAELAGCAPLAPEAAWDELLPGIRVMAARLHELGSRAVVITGGHLNPANDYLSYLKAGTATEEVLPGTHLESRSTHGTGCALAMSLGCQLARGRELPEAVLAAKDYVRRAIAAAYPMGKGIGPINHLV